MLPADRFNDDRGDAVRIRLEGVRNGLGVVVRERDGGVAEALRYAGGIGQPERGDARARFHQQRIDVPVIAAFELDGDVAFGEASGDAKSAHGGFGAGVNEPKHFHRRDEGANGFGQFDFAFRGRAEAGAIGEGAFEGFDDFRMAMAEQQKVPMSRCNRCIRCHRRRKCGSLRRAR